MARIASRKGLTSGFYAIIPGAARNIPGLCLTSLYEGGGALFPAAW